MRLILAFLLYLVLAGPSLATDGVLEINQTCAVQTGCIDNSGGIGDTPGFPVAIEIPGSYILTSDLVVSDPNTDGLFIATAPVTIDLNGFEIQGPVNCIGLGPTLTCDAGTGRGIRSTFVRSTVVNGSVIKFGSDGIQLGGRSRIERVVVERNGGDGIDVSGDSVVVACRAYRNGGDGIEANTSSTVESSTSASNRVQGFNMANGAVISASTARDNGAHGIVVLHGSTVSGSSAYQNQGIGILALSGSTVVGNAAYENGEDGINVSFGSTVSDNSVYMNGDAGISALGGSSIQRDAVRSNGSIDGGYGLKLGSDDTYRENTITDNVTGAVTGTGVNLGANYCAGTGVTSASCP
jgi:hypothetical protein